MNKTIVTQFIKCLQTCNDNNIPTLNIVEVFYITI